MPPRPARRRPASIALAAALSALLALTACERVHPAFITDDQGRALILHGMNISGQAKGPIWHFGTPTEPDTGLPWISEADAHRFSQDWGFNVARYLIFWQHVEPQPGVYDEAYLDAVAERVRWLGDAGVTVILDMHQDVYGKRDTEGRAIGFDGAPQWATITDGEPFTFRSPWSFNYFEPAVFRSFDHFWNGDQGAHPELQQRYIAMWAHVAARFASTPNVLGYDLMNEPSAGSRYGFVVPGPLTVVLGDPAAQAAFEANQLASFTTRAVAGIRAADPDGWIFVEPCVTGANEGSRAYLPKIDDSRAGAPHIAYFPHYYSLLMAVSGTYDPAIDTSIRDWAVHRLEEGHRMEAPILIGEWGAGPEFQNYLANLQETADMADQVTSGWTYWDHSAGGWGIIDGHGRETERANVLVRTYPKAVAGEPIAYAYQPKDRSFALAWKDVAGVTGPTEIYVPARRFYPNGFDLFVSDTAGTWSSAWDATREVLSVTTDPATTDHVLRLVPKP